MTGVEPLNPPDKRAFIAEFVQSMTEAPVFPESFPPVVEAALAANILDETAEISEELINQWYDLLVSTISSQE